MNCMNCKLSNYTNYKVNMVECIFKIYNYILSTKIPSKYNYRQVEIKKVEKATSCKL